MLHTILYSCVLCSGEKLSITLSKSDHRCDGLYVLDPTPSCSWRSVLLYCFYILIFHISFISEVYYEVVTILILHLTNIGSWGDTKFLFLGLKLTTFAPQNKTQVSSCFFLWELIRIIYIEWSLIWEDILEWGCLTCSGPPRSCPCVMRRRCVWSPWSCPSDPEVSPAARRWTTSGIGTASPDDSLSSENRVGGVKTNRPTLTNTDTEQSVVALSWLLVVHLDVADHHAAADESRGGLCARDLHLIVPKSFLVCIPVGAVLWRREHI